MRDVSEHATVVITSLALVLLGWLVYGLRQSTAEWRSAADKLSLRIDMLVSRFDSMISTDHVRRAEFERRGEEIEEIHRKQMQIDTRLSTVERDMSEYRRYRMDRSQDGG